MKLNFIKEKRDKILDDKFIQENRITTESNEDELYKKLNVKKDVNKNFF
jgi:hypothetical protein